MFRSLALLVVLTTVLTVQTAAADDPVARSGL